MSFIDAEFHKAIISFTYYLAAFLFIALIVLAITVVTMYVIDITQSQHTLRRNYPVLGRFRYLFERLGEFFRQYFFALDREELPFNRAQRSWVYRAAKKKDTTVGFGSTKDLRPVGSVFFINCPYPTLDQDIAEANPITIGAYCPNPYKTASLVNISGMSYGAISKPAVLALSKGAKMAGCWMNTGEGGLSQYHLEGGGDIVFQIGTAKNGVRTRDGRLDDKKLAATAAYPQVKMFELKLSQGAKPGKGGLLPGAKVTAEIAKIRGLEQGKDAISPNRHPEINNNSDLLNMLNHIRNVTAKPVGIKMVLGAHGWLSNLGQEITDRGIESAPDFITIDGADGGSGAAPMALIDDMGLPLRESLAMLIDTLEKYKLRERIKVIASGKLITPADVAWALCIGTDFVVSARGFMFALGCIQALKCNKNICPTGITTHNPKLQQGLVPEDKATRVFNYVKKLIHETGVIAHSCGVSNPRELRRSHARVVMPNGLSIPMSELYPAA